MTETVSLSKKVLWVEDSEVVHEYLLKTLQQIPGLALTPVATTALDALQIYVREKPDILILDLVLKSGSGFDVLQAIRQHDASCYVVVFTGHDSEQHRQRASELGANVCFSKHKQYPEFIRLLHILGRGDRNSR